MKHLFCSFVGVILCLTLLFLTGCGIPRKYVKMKEQGYLPDANDFPNTLWKCREIDLSFQMMDNGERYVVGTYTANGQSFHTVGKFGYWGIGFSFYSTTTFSQSEYQYDGEHFIHYDNKMCGFVNTDYIYENETINCTVVAFQDVGEPIPSELTFEKVGRVAQIPGARLTAKELDMYLDAYDDVNGYYKGEIVLDGKKCSVQAYEIGYGGLYQLSIQNGIVNNLKSTTSSTLVFMKFESAETGMIAKITDDYLGQNGKLYPNWSYSGYKGAVVTFERETND